MKVRDWGKIKAGTLLIVTWNDIVEVANWTSDEDARNLKPTVCKTVGWFVNDDKDVVRLTWSVAEDGDKSVVVIPKGCIQDVRNTRYK